MKRGLFFRLALTGIRKNRRLYVPYLLSCVGMVMMFYILSALSVSPLIHEMKGGGNLGTMLSLGKFVIAAFSLLFLFYTHSFLIRRRLREFGLYHVLGMDRRKIARVVLWESVLVAVISLVCGTGLGIAFSKLAELGLRRAVGVGTDYRLIFGGTAIAYTVQIYLVIFAVLLVRSLWQVRRAKPLELLLSETAGEKPPRANWLVALLGLILLGVAYYLAVTIHNPLTTLMLFFAAAIMVIVATYLLFMAGSVALCRILQKNKRYYYQKRHFVSVSSMVYRMKRNGAGLASICVLSTMVLVMIASTSSLYFGAEDALRTRFPQENSLEIGLDTPEEMSDRYLQPYREAYGAVFDKEGVTPSRVVEYRYASLYGILSGTRLEPESSGMNVAAYERLYSLYFISAADYNAAMDTHVSVQPGQALLYTMRCTYTADTLTVGDTTLAISGTLTEYPAIDEAMITAMPDLMLVVADYGELTPLLRRRDADGDTLLSLCYYYGYDLNADDETAIRVLDRMTGAMKALRLCDGEGCTYQSSCMAEERADFFVTFGGLFFVGIILSLVFGFAAAMIIYYKQVSEGYEDRRRFSIMQKVGMTGEDIKMSINSQVLTVFFAPLLMAGIHLVFAFPMVWKLLQLFNLRNITLVILVTVGAFAAFGLLYALVYKITARAYYTIVSSEDAS